MDAMSASERNAVKASPPAGRNLSQLVTDIGRRISKRLSPEELVAKHIMPAEAVSANYSPELAAQKQAQESATMKNSLNRKLSMRSTKDDLKLRNIIKGSFENLVPEEKFHAKQTELKSILKKRPDKDQLKQMNILKGSDINLSQAEKQEISSKIESFLDDRPSASSLKNSKILFFSEEIEVAATYKKTEYNRKPDDDLTFKRLTPQLKSQIREELNQYKKTEMMVHAESSHNTCFH